MFLISDNFNFITGVALALFVIWYTGFLKEFFYKNPIIKYLDMRKKRKRTEAIDPEVDKLNQAPTVSVPVTEGVQRLLLSVGINNFQLPQWALRGCVNDSHTVIDLFSQRGYKAIQLLDEQATQKNIEAALIEASKNLKSGDFFIYHHSGHGAQKPDTTGDESDGQDEFICTYDMLQGGLLLDDRLHQIFGGFPTGVNVLMIADTCHSASNSRFAEFNMNAIEYVNRAVSSDDLRGIVFNRFAPTEVKENEVNIFHISGSADDSTSADMFDNETGKHCGALTKYLIESIKELPENTPISKVYEVLRTKLPNLGLHQVPAFEAPAGKDTAFF